MDLNDILSDKPVPAIEPEKPESTDVKPPAAEQSAQPEPAASSAAKAEEKPPEAKAPEDTQPQPRDETGRFAKTVPQEALHAERQRRQQAEAELERLRQQPAKPPTSVLEDEDKAFSERLEQATAPLRQQFFNLSVSHARRVSGREDYQHVYDYMSEEIQKDPQLAQGLRAAEDPGEWIYTMGKTRKELAEVGGDITKLRDHATSAVRAELDQTKQALKAMQAELAALKASQEKRSNIPQSLNSEPSAAVRGGESFAGPTPLKSILQ